jgi:ABC-type Fe3+ transport system substrate-binding protein
LIERLRNESTRSPADVLFTVDAGRLWRAEQWANAPSRSATATIASVCSSRKSPRTGAPLNASGAAALKNAPHRDAAIRFLEYLASDEAQAYFANGNNEWPVVKTVSLANRELASLGSFKADELNVSVLGRNQSLAQKIFDRAGFK